MVHDNTKIIFLLTIVIAIGSIFTILSFLSTTGLLGEVGNLQGEFQTLSDQVSSQEGINIEDLLAQLPVDQGTTTPTEIIIQQPEGFTATDQDIISAFLDAIGVTQTETFGVKANIELIDANFEQQIASSFATVQPLDPRTVIVQPDIDIDTLRFFINTDFSTQIADNGRNYHKFSGWDIIQDFGNGASIPIVVITSSNCGGIENTGICIQVIGSKNDDDDTRNGTWLHGIGKKISISDWTGDGDLVLAFDWQCNAGFRRSANVMVVTIQGDSVLRQEISTCTGSPEKFTTKINNLVDKNGNSVLGNSEEVTVQIGVRVGNVDKFRADYKFNNVQIIGDSILKRVAVETIGLIDSLSIIQNDAEQRILDLGFIQLDLIGETVFPNEKVLLTGDFETRINDKTITKHQLTANGITDTGGQIVIRVDGQNEFIFKVDEQFYQEDTFQKLTFIVDNLIVNVGEGAEQRIFEYHIPFTAYLLEFNVRSDEIVAFNEDDLAISVLKNDSTFISCGTSTGDMTPEVLPPSIELIANSFTFAITNPEAGKNAITDPITKEVQKDTEFCQTVPNLPRDTEITFKVGNQFFEVASPVTQANYFVKCTPIGCSSNIGYSTTT